MNGPINGPNLTAPSMSTGGEFFFKKEGGTTWFRPKSYGGEVLLHPTLLQRNARK